MIAPCRVREAILTHAKRACQYLKRDYCKINFETAELPARGKGARAPFGADTSDYPHLLKQALSEAMMRDKLKPEEAATFDAAIKLLNDRHDLHDLMLMVVARLHDPKCTRRTD